MVLSGSLLVHRDYAVLPTVIVRDPVRATWVIPPLAVHDETILMYPWGNDYSSFPDAFGVPRHEAICRVPVIEGARHENIVRLRRVEREFNSLPRGLRVLRGGRLPFLDGLPFYGFSRPHSNLPVIFIPNQI